MQDTTNTIAERTAALAEHRARLDTFYARYERNAAGTARDAIAIGGELVAINAILRAEKYGNWEKWVKENCKFDVRTARRFIKAYEMRFDAILIVDPVEFMRRVWGNEGPKAKKEKNGSDVTSEARSGGSKFNAPLTSDKGQAALDRLRALVKRFLRLPRLYPERESAARRCDNDVGLITSSSVIPSTSPRAYPYRDRESPEDSLRSNSDTESRKLKRRAVPCAGENGGRL